MAEALLEVRGLTVRYGAAVALADVSLQVARGEMVALVGPNGAGKTTLLNAISGVIRPMAGRILLSGRVTQVPEGRQLFADMSVEDNLRIGAWSVRQRDPAAVYELLPRLRELRGRIAGTLSGGEQQMVAVGRALMSTPDLLAIDELSLGLAPLVVDSLAQHLRSLNRERATAILLVEQNVRLALELCPRAYVLEAGRIVLSGSAEELASSAAVQAAYLGGAPEPVPAVASGSEDAEA
ncbi:MAG: ABC transporter ATP-binding protein [Candidatus Dormibacteraeota bacterium]|uniref:ABC transporter ATP-binding protein n=1 Tax=Candidatus Dormiibacter inghamiae TaxID=3127013 RepID=A0A934NC38_9BACT|nr:ABC transporter ATP-binding protein [Candidatus Dormibacteraeota bacterium]MBJ7606838.1 ABC transporter ATP-binding protein [Candidatus Dormibacteraeota bacterium]